MVIPRGRVRRVANISFQFVLLFAVGFALTLRLPQVSGFSMEPRIDNAEWVVINTFAFRVGPPQHSEIVAFTHNGSRPEVFLKRIIGLPGDRVFIDRGVVYVNGVKLDEPYVAYADTRSFDQITVPPDSYYVLGDNRAASNDSRAFGTVPAASLIGPAVFAVWPSNKIGPIR